MSTQEQAVLQESVSPDVVMGPKGSGVAPAAAPDKAAAEKVAEAEASGDPDYSRQFAALTKKQKEIYLREKELKEKWSLVEKYEKLEKLKAENPWGFAKEHGLNFDSLAQAALKDGEPESVEDKIARLEAKLEAEAKSKKEQEEKLAEQEKIKAQTEAVNNYRKELNAHIEANPEDYEQILLENEQEEVLNYVIGYYNKTLEETGEGVVMPYKQAADKIEEALVARNKEKAQKYINSKKLGLRQEPPQPAKAPERTMGATISQAMTPSTSAPAPRNETPEEKLRRIAAEFNAKLKKT